LSAKKGDIILPSLTPQTGGDILFTLEVNLWRRCASY